MMKNIKYLLIIITLFIGIKCISAIDNNDIKVYDYALILNDNQKLNLTNKINEFIDKTNTNLIIVTVRHTSTKNIEDYINEFYKKYINEDAILLVLNLGNDNDKLNMQAFGNVKKLYNDIQIKEILKLVKIDDNNYKTLTNFIEQLELNNIHINNYNKYLDIRYWILILVPSIILSSIIVLIKFLKSKNSEQEIEKNMYLKLDSLLIEKRLDNFLTTHTSKSRIK